MGRIENRHFFQLTENRRAFLACGGFAVVDDTIQHPVIVLHSHLCVFQIVFGFHKALKLHKANPIYIVKGYLMRHLQGYDVAHGHTVTTEILRVVDIELGVQPFQHYALVGVRREGSRINHIVVFDVRFLATALQSGEGFKTLIPGLVNAFQLKD